jgi:hypothetical protein
MKLTAHLAAVLALVFGLICLAVGVNGLWQVRDLADATERADAQGFAWFWLFLAAVALTTAVLSHLMARGRLGRLE